MSSVRLRSILGSSLFALSLVTLVSACASAEASADMHPGGSLVTHGVELELEGAAPEIVVNPTLELAAFEEPAAPIATEFRCVGPEPRGHWAGRASDDEWARGLYPAIERYPEGWLALTFDDGPHVSRTKVVLDELARHDQHATFFLTGHAIRKGTYELVQRMVAEGHTLANHGFRHDAAMAEQVDSIEELERYIASELELTQIRVDLALLATSPEAFAAMESRVFRKLTWLDDRQEQLDAMPKLRERHRALLEEHGFAGEQRPLTLAWVRPPGGNPYLGKRWTSDERDAFARVVNRMGLAVAMWNHGSSDSDPALTPQQRMDPERITETGRKAARRGGVYVAHDRIDPEAVRALLGAIAKTDAKVVSLDELHRAKLEAQGHCS